MFKRFFTDRKSRLARIWSNQELKKFAHFFDGDIVNVSGWRDEDKENNKYIEYFSKKNSYTITNYLTHARGFQGKENEIFLDLEEEIDGELIGRFDVVFNHTVLEHIFEVETAFKNLCDMTKDIVILIVPFLQPMHADYGDYWRFTPTCLEKLFNKNSMKVLYCSFNNPINGSVYIFCIASKQPQIWNKTIHSNLDNNGKVNIFCHSIFNDGQDSMVGANAIINIGPCVFKFLRKIRGSFKKPKN